MSRLNMRKTFTVLAGKDKQNFTLHTDVSSTFFKAALKEGGKESRNNQVALPETDPACFEGYAQWLSTGDLTVDKDFEMDFKDLTDFYILGDCHRHPEFCNAVLHGFAGHT